MSWDPEVDDPAEAQRRPAAQPSDVGVDHSRDYGDEPAPSWRDTAPDPLAPIDPNAPVSGHVVPKDRPSVTEAPENDWSAASGGLYPLLRPAGTTGTPLDALDPEALVTRGAGHGTTAPVIDEGPVDTVIVFALPSGGFDVIVNGEHVIAWDVNAQKVVETAIANLTAWSRTAGWTDEADGERRLISSATGDGWDASRILLTEVRQHLTRELGASGGRVMVGLPDRHLLVAARLPDGDDVFAGQFASFVRTQAEGADEPIDARVFELKDGELAPFTA
jgi:hypothetical protein